VKFTNSVHLEVATKKLSCFKLNTEHGLGRICRFLPFVGTLSRNPADRNPQERNPEYQEFTPELENMPDNTQKLTNLCVKGIDSSLTEADLHLMFRRFGEIKSAKIARDPITSQSIGYGYVWFADEFACL
jgi:RNA recognition motif-containing protein